MAEIKSTLDLIMEKTKHLTLSAQEKQQIEREDHLKKVPGYVQRFLDDALSLSNLIRELAAAPEPLREEIRRELIRRFLERFSLTATGKKSLEALQELSGSQNLARVRQLRSLLERFEASREELVTVQTERMRAELAATGISGSAVVVRVEASPQWLALELEYHRELSELQDAWLTALAAPY